MRKVIILRGPSGCGKSTWAMHEANNLAGKDCRVEVLSTDQFWVSDGGSHEFDLAKLPEAHNHCLSRFYACLRRGVEGNYDRHVVIVDNTNQRRWEYEAYIQGAWLAKYAVEIRRWDVQTVREIRACADRSRHNV